MIKKLIYILLILGLSVNNVYADTVSRYFTYGTNSEVTSTNLNGNLDNIVTEVNGKLTNDNAKTSAGFRFYEVLSSSPTAGTQGRFVYDKSDDIPAFDNGTSFVDMVTVSGTQTLTNKTLTTPTIGSFTNATHNHSNTAGGGQITASAIPTASGEIVVGNTSGVGATVSASGDIKIFADGSAVIQPSSVNLGEDVVSVLPVANGGTNASDATTARSNLGLGSISTQNSNNVSITGGAVSGITDLAVADGGTGASTAADARTNLGVLDNSIASGEVVVGNSSGSGAEVALTGAVRIDNTGFTEIRPNSIGSSELNSTTVTAGAYTSTNLTVDSDGRIISASNGSSGSALQNSRILYTGGSFSTSSGSFVDIDATNAAITITTGANPCLVSFGGTLSHTTTADPMYIELLVDGVAQGGTTGLVENQRGATGLRTAFSYTYQTAALTAASHTFKLQWYTAGGTANWYATTTNPFHMWVTEVSD